MTKAVTEEEQCAAELPDQWGYGQRCCLKEGHSGLHRYENGGFVIMWGWEY